MGSLICFETIWNGRLFFPKALEFSLESEGPLGKQPVWATRKSFPPCRGFWGLPGCIPFRPAWLAVGTMGFLSSQAQTGPLAASHIPLDDDPWFFVPLISKSLLYFMGASFGLHVLFIPLPSSLVSLNPSFSLNHAISRHQPFPWCDTNIFKLRL